MSRRAVALRRGPASTAGVAAPADKRFLRPDVRPGRHRRLGVLIGRAVVALAAVLLIAGGVAWARHALFTSRWLAVSRIVVRGNVRLSQSDVEALMSGVRGENILEVDLDQYRRRLMDSPWVANATMWRVLPATIEVQVVERVPMAIGRLGQQLYLVDREGVIIGQYGPQQRDFDLPIVDGLGSTAAGGGSGLDPARVQLAEKFLDALQPRGDLRQRISQVDVSSPHDVVVLIDQDPALLHLGEDRFVERLQTYIELAPTLQAKVANIDYVDLRFDDRVYFRSQGQTTSVTKAKR